jgi:phosphoglycolate phosphatase
MGLPVRAVLLDFDYTLADSSAGVVTCINFALGQLGLPSVSAEVASQTIGLSLPDTLIRLAGAECATLAPEFARLFIERADQVMAESTHLLECVPGAIAALRERGLVLGVVSTKFRYRIASILGREGLLDSFDLIVGGEDVVVHKPHPEGLCLALKRLGRSASDSIYVGDSVVDADTAQEAGVPFVAVLTGVTQRQAFDARGVADVLGSVGDLPGWLGR